MGGGGVPRKEAHIHQKGARNFLARRASEWFLGDGRDELKGRGGGLFFKGDKRRKCRGGRRILWGPRSGWCRVRWPVKGLTKQN